MRTGRTQTTFRFIRWIGVSLFFILLPMNSADAQVEKDGFVLDFNRFSLKNGDSFVEIYYSIPRQKLNYQAISDGHQAGGLIQTFIKMGDKAMLADSLVITDVTKSLSEITPTQKFTEQTNIQLSPGRYEIVTRFIDLVSKKMTLVTDSIRISARATMPAISDIQLASTLSRQPKAENKFDKNGLRVVPNPSRAYGSGFSKLFYYAEIYALEFQGAGSDSTFCVNYAVLDVSGAVVKQVPGNHQTKPGSSAVIHGSFDLEGLSSGFYSFQIEVTDDRNGRTAVQQKEFQIFRPGDFLVSQTESPKPIEETGKVDDEFALMSEKEIDDYFLMVKYIALKDEKKLFDNLDLNGKRNFMNNFWQQRDPEPRTAINERKKEYLECMGRANEQFSMGQKMGWKTDRGRVLLVYGHPDEIESVPSDGSTKSYEIWHYYSVEGGVIFVFVDIMRIKDYRLVHSTHRNEIQEPGWQERYLGL
ncbi:MAG: GWxTD domain-containing protein [Candidatus Zhuqueibacterota bacterium]